MKLKNLLITVIALAGTLLFSTIAFATPSASIMYQETNLGNGYWQYDYIFNNTSTTAGENLYKVFLKFNQLSTVTGSPLPSGWAGTVWVGTNTNTYIDAMAFNKNNYIASNNSLSGFSFTINHQVGDIPFSAEFKTDQGGRASILGTTGAQSPVAPEPVSTVLFLVGGGTLMARRLLRKKRS